MSSERFEKIMPFLLRWECVRDKQGNVIAENDPDDPGGLTKFGIDLRSHPELGEAGICGLTQAQATEIYRREYWERNGCERLAWPLGEVFFNACVNCGRARADKIMAAAEAGTTPVGKAAAFLKEQAAFYRRLAEQKPALQKFLRGWLNRVDDLRKFLGLPA